MNTPSRATVALCVTFLIALVLVWILVGVHDPAMKWLPQTVVTLAGLVGASWFAGHRLDLLDKGIDQRHASADAQLNATEKSNFNAAIKEAVDMMSSDKLPVTLAGQRWLHSIAAVGVTEANLVLSLLCMHVATTKPSQTPSSPNDPLIKSRQSALDLLFHSPGKSRFDQCDARAELMSTDCRALKFRDLDLTGANLANSDLTGALIVGTRFDQSDLRATKWSGTVGGDSRTFMRGVRLYGAEASSCEFINIDLRGAQLQNNGRQTVFRSCVFKTCIFEGSDWTGATFERCKFEDCDFSGVIWTRVTLEMPVFESCPTVTFDLCKQTKRLFQPAGLPNELLVQLREIGGLD